MDIKMVVEVSDDGGIDKMISNLKGLDGTEVEAGLFGGFAKNKAIWNEYGTSRGIPARPFLRNTLYGNEARFAQFVTPFVEDILNGASVGVYASNLGNFMVSRIRQTIDEGNFVPLAPSTVAKKGHSRPLIDTGDMYGSIDWRAN